MQPPATPAAEAYKGLAPFYDELTREHDYDAWTLHLEQRARRFGVRGKRLLDAACGTGKSFLPLLERGYRVTGCDMSPEMLDLARAKAPEAELFLADVRALGRVGEFDLITCLDDIVNYLIERRRPRGRVRLARTEPGARRGARVRREHALDLPHHLRARHDARRPGRVPRLARQMSEDGRAGLRRRAAIEAFSEGDAGRLRARHDAAPSAPLPARRESSGARRRRPHRGGRVRPAAGRLARRARPDDDLHHKLIYFAQRVAKGGDTE